MRRFAHTYATMLRVGLAEAVAYRAEFIVWMLSTTMPLVMLALWSAVAREHPFGRFGEADFVAYYLAALIVRTLTGSWVVWEMNQEIRMGTLGLRLLRPIHPFVAYSAQHLAAVPLRAVMAVPVALIMLLATSGARIVHDPLLIAALLVSLAGAWTITFLAMLIIGTLGLFIDKSIAVFEVWLGLFAILSGYLVPLELLPSWLSGPAQVLPFRYMLGFSVELMIGLVDRRDALIGLGIQAVTIVALVVIAKRVWRAGLRRFEAFGS